MTIPVLRSVLVSTDLTHRCDARVASAAALAEATGARLHAVHVLHEGTPATEEELERGRRRLARQLARVVPATVRVASQRVLGGAPYRALAESAARVSADLVVLGPAPAVTWADRLFGTAGDRVLRALDVPLLVLREPLELPLRCVSVALRGAEPGRAATGTALRWAAALGTSQMRVVRVLAPGTRAPGVVPAPAAVTHAEEGVRVTAQALFAERPAEEVVRMAERDRPGLLVVEADARRPLGVRGWTTVARLSPVPVLVVPRAPAPAPAARRVAVVRVARPAAAVG
jgi:nucleotide-binding universal stress UspA family protein